MNINIYRDDVCRECDVYVEKMSKWCNEHNATLKIFYVETDITLVMNAIIESREKGADVDVLPFTIINSGEDEEIYDGMLLTDEEVNTKLEKYI